MMIQKENIMYTKNERLRYIAGTPVNIAIANIRNYNLHCHENAMEFAYCLSGSAVFNIAHEHMILNEGEVVLIEHENFHSIQADSDNIILLFHIDIKNCIYPWEKIKYMYFSCATKLCKPHHIPHLQKIYEALLTASYIYASRDTHFTESYNKIANILLDLVVNYFTWFSIETFTSEDSKKFKNRLDRILSYVQKHYNEKITLSQIAQNEYINENYFSQFLKRTSFHSFTKMLNYIRCFEAEKLLLKTDLPIQEISDICGFSSKKYLHKYFKEFWKTTPFQHRKKSHENSLIQNDFYYFSPEESLPLIEKKICEYLKSKLLK